MCRDISGVKTLSTSDLTLCRVHVDAARDGVALAVSQDITSWLIARLAGSEAERSGVGEPKGIRLLATESWSAAVVLLAAC